MSLEERHIDEVRQASHCCQQRGHEDEAYDDFSEHHVVPPSSQHPCGCIGTAVGEYPEVAKGAVNAHGCRIKNSSRRGDRRIWIGVACRAYGVIRRRHGRPSRTQVAGSSGREKRKPTPGSVMM